MLKLLIANKAVYEMGVQVSTWYAPYFDSMDDTLEEIGAGEGSDDGYIVLDYENTYPIDFEISEDMELSILEAVAEELEGLNDFEMAQLGAYIEATGTVSIKQALEDYININGFYQDTSIYDMVVEDIQENSEVPEWLHGYINYDDLCRTWEMDGFNDTSFGVIHL